MSSIFLIRWIVIYYTYAEKLTMTPSLLCIKYITMRKYGYLIHPLLYSKSYIYIYIIQPIKIKKTHLYIYIVPFIYIYYNIYHLLKNKSLLQSGLLNFIDDIRCKMLTVKYDPNFYLTYSINIYHWVIISFMHI